MNISEYQATRFDLESSDIPPAEASRTKRILQFFKKDVTKANIIVEAGCGTGKLRHLYISNAKRYGLDISPNSLLLAKSHGYIPITHDLNEPWPLLNTVTHLRPFQSIAGTIILRMVKP